MKCQAMELKYYWIHLETIPFTCTFPEIFFVNKCLSAPSGFDMKLTRLGKTAFRLVDRLVNDSSTHYVLGLVIWDWEGIYYIYLSIYIHTCSFSKISVESRYLYFYRRIRINLARLKLLLLCFKRLPSPSYSIKDEAPPFKVYSFPN